MQRWNLAKRICADGRYLARRRPGSRREQIAGFMSQRLSQHVGK